MEEKDRSCMLATWQCFSGGLEQAVRHSCRPSGITRCRNAPGFTKPSLIQACSCIILNLTVFVSVCWRRSSLELLFMEQVEKYKYKYKYKCKYKCKCKFKYKYILCAAHTSWSSLMRMPEARHFAGCLNKHVFVVVFFYFAGCLNKHDRCAEEKALHSPIPRFVWLDNVWFYIYIFIVKYVKMNILFPGCCHRMEMLWKAMISSLISTCHYSHIMEIKYFLWKS